MSRALTLVLIAAAVACDGPDGGSPNPPDQGGDGSALASVALGEDEVPEGLEPAEQGPISSIQGVLPPRRRDPNLPPLPEGVRGSFAGGYRRSFVGEDRSASSTVVRMTDASAASDLLTYLELLPVGGHAADPADVQATGLGEEGFGWHLLVPESESSGFVWRSGALVASVTLSGPIGAAGPNASLPLAGRVDRRLR